MTIVRNLIEQIKNPDTVNGAQSENVQLYSLLTIAEIGKSLDLEVVHEQLQKALIHSFNSSHEEVKSALRHWDQLSFQLYFLNCSFMLLLYSNFSQTISLLTPIFLINIALNALRVFLSYARSYEQPQVTSGPFASILKC